DRTNLLSGLLLAVHIDAVFEVGVISFADNGEILISPALSGSDAAALGVDKGMRLRSVDDRHIVPLDYHRSKRYRKGRRGS
ncbi:MAG: HNH endonuclease, partial [Opitutae bacterium]|nr:HNH endonuclease [Opitutae bacterium]